MLQIMWFYSYLLRPCSAILQDTNLLGVNRLSRAELLPMC